jgi:hypothetical protein
VVTERSRDESADAVVISQAVRIERFTFAAAVGGHNLVNKPAQLVEVAGGRFYPPLVFVQFLKEKGSERILTLRRRKLEPFDRLLQCFGHAHIIVGGGRLGERRLWLMSSGRPARRLKSKPEAQATGKIRLTRLRVRQRGGGRNWTYPLSLPAPRRCPGGTSGAIAIDLALVAFQVAMGSRTRRIAFGSLAVSGSSRWCKETATASPSRRIYVGEGKIQMQQG